MSYIYKKEYIEPIDNYISIEDHLKDLHILLKVQQNLLNNTFVTRKKLTTKRHTIRALDYTYNERELFIYEKIKKSINYYETKQRNNSECQTHKI